MNEDAKTEKDGLKKYKWSSDKDRPSDDETTSERTVDESNKETEEKQT